MVLGTGRSFQKEADVSNLQSRHQCSGLFSTRCRSGGYVYRSLGHSQIELLLGHRTYTPPHQILIYDPLEVHHPRAKTSRFDNSRLVDQLVN